MNQLIKINYLKDNFAKYAKLNSTTEWHIVLN